MTDSLIETAKGEPDAYDRIWGLAVKLRDSGVLDLYGERNTYGDLLHELEKHQQFLEVYEGSRPEIEPSEDTLSADDQEVLAQLRKTFPSEEDRIWQRALTSWQVGVVLA